MSEEIIMRIILKINTLFWINVLVAFIAISVYKEYLE